MSIQLCLYSFSKYLLNIFYLRFTVLGSRHTRLKGTHNLALSRCFEIQWLCVSHPTLSPNCNQYLLQWRQEWSLHICMPRNWTGIWWHALHDSSLHCHHLNEAAALGPDADLILCFLMWQIDVFKQSQGGRKASPLAPGTSMSQCLMQPRV